MADIVQRLGLSTPVFHARVEDVLTRAPFDTLVVRAVARLRKLLEWFRPHWEAFDRLLVLKGPALDRGSRRGPTLRADARRVAEANVLSAAGHGIGERAAANTLAPPKGKDSD